MYRIQKWFVSVLLLTVLLIPSVPGALAMAPGAGLPPNTPISSDGGVLAMPEAYTTSRQAPARGTGTLAPASQQLIPASELQLPPVDGAVPESVIAPDGRTRTFTTTTYPYRAIAFLVVTWAGHGSGTCTGWFYGPRTVGTAGHCVYDKSHGWGWATSIKVYPGRNGATAPYGYTTAHRLFSVVGWTSSGSPNYDYGTIQTDAAKGNTVGWFGFWWQSSNTFPGGFTVAGYPGDKPYGTQWKMAGMITNVTTNRLWYSIDTYGGQSGSPLYQKPSWATVCCYAAAYHTYGVGMSPYPSKNSATRITQAGFNNMVAWKNRAYP